MRRGMQIAEFLLLIPYPEEKSMNYLQQDRYGMHDCYGTRPYWDH